MRIATWNVNSLKARQEAVEKWLERAAPDILLMQETKLTDDDAPVMAFAMAGYQLVHHGEGRWNGVAIAARDGLSIADVVTNFGDGPVRDSGPGGAGGRGLDEEDFDPFDEARMLAATVDGIRLVSLYAPNGRVVGSPFYAGKLAWFERLARWIRDESGVDLAERRPGPRRRPQRRPDRRRRLGRRTPRTAARTCRSPSGRRSGRCSTRAWSTATGRATRSRGRFTWWDYRAGMFHKNFGMRIDHLLRHAGRRRAGRGRRDRPRGAQGPAGPVRPRPAVDRPRRAGQAVRSRLGWRARADREAHPLTIRPTAEAAARTAGAA